MDRAARPMRRWRRVAVVALPLVLAAVGAGWWSTQLWGLPDIGDPFDVAAFEAASGVPDERNAFVEYHHAASLVSRDLALATVENLSLR